MNKHFYRVVFNRARGMLIVVAELIKRHQGAGRSSSKAKLVRSTATLSTALALNTLTVVTYLTLGWVSLIQPSFANTIVVDNSADKTQRPVVTTAANGVSQINIQTPSKAGVSHNKFTQFDVTEKGVILNNSAQMSQTQLGGYIKGNDFLVPTGGAKIILNEVNAKNASQLNGYIEVAGQKAQVVIANAAGITCNGCGFINADRATLTTGKPILDNGQLKGYLVEKGNIAINGKGLDSAKQTYTDLIARTVSINSSLWANEARVIAGKNKVSADLSQIEKQASDETDKPALAIDVAALGGMYAGKIQMVGTESGVGVHNAGKLGASAGGITITADGKIVNSGSIQAKQDIAITSQQASVENSAKIYAQGSAKLTAKTKVDNQSSIITQQDLALSANHVNNGTNATIAAGVDADGRLTQTGNLTVNAQNATLNGKQLANNNAALKVSDSLDMKGSQNQLGSLDIQSSTLDTQNSAFNVTGDAKIITGDWNNQTASFRVGNTFDTQANHIINTDSTLFANNLSVIATSLTGDSKLLADSSLTLNLQQDFSNQREIMSNGSLSISSQGNIHNVGTLSSGSNLTLQAQDMINDKDASIESSTVSVTGNNLTNNGLINSDNLAIKLNNQLNNYDAGTLYGNDIRITAKELNNQAHTSDVAPAIAARNKLTIDAETINNINHALLLSLGDLDITSNTVNNHSSKIESAGDMTLIIDTLNNINDLIETQEVLVGNKHVVEYSPLGSSKRYTPDEVKIYTSPKTRHRYKVLESLDGSFDTTYKFIQYDYDVKNYETQITNTNPAEIIAGKNLTIQANHVENDNSKIIAGNTLAIDATTLNNISLQGTERTTSQGNAISYSRKKEKTSAAKAVYKQKKSSSVYQDEVVTTIDLATAKIDDHQVINANNTNINAPTTVNIDSGSVGLVEPNTTLPNNSIYIINKDVEKNYLIETDPKFTNRKNWLSSDYMFKELKADPNNIQKRLGDGYYEQQLIREQVTTMTGQRYLGDYSDDLSQYQALMNAGVAFGNQYGLTIGVALSPKQMEALTTDIVWMVSKTVMVDGQPMEVLVPQVYVVNRPKVTTEGALLAGKNVELKTSGDVNSSGSVLAKESVDISSNNVINSGSIIGDRINLSAKDSITNQGMLAGDKQVSLSASNDINLQSTTSTTQTDYGQNKSINTVIDKVSTVQVNNGDMTIHAGHDVNLGGALVVNNGETGETNITAGNDINLSTVKTEKQQDIIWNKNNYRKEDTEKTVGSKIISKGDINLVSGNDITIKAGNVSADKSLNLSAEHNVSIESDTEREQLTDHQKEKMSGLLSKGSTTTHIEVDNTTQQGSSLSGETVNIKTGNDLSITGSQVTSTKDMSLAAGGNVDIDAAEESYYSKTQTITKKSGMMSSGGLGVTIGKETTDLKQTDTQQGYQASTIGSTEGNVTITAGKDIKVQGSDIIAKQDVNLTGENVDIAAKDSETKYKEEYKYEKSGLTLAVTGTAADIYDAAKAVDNAKKKDNDTLLALQSIKAGLTAVQAAQDLELKNKEGQPQASIGVSASIGSQKTERVVNQEQHNVVSSGVSAGDNITITTSGDSQKAGGNINVIGSEVKAGQDITLNANNDVNVIGAVNTQHSDKDEKSTGSSVGIQLQFGGDESGFRFKGNANFSQERENANGSAWTEGVVDAGKNLNIKTGNDANIVGGQLKGESVKAEIGNNLNIQSLQDTDNYDYEKLSASVGGSAGFGGGSLNVVLDQTKMNSKWASVTDQSGIYAGKDGFDITVGNNTDLKGAVIASTAEDKSKNKLDTGTISFEDIKNKADFNVSHVSVSVGTSMSGSPTPGAPSIYQNSGSDSSTTKSAVEGGTLIMRDGDKQTQNVDSLSRDTANANNPLGQIFDKQKEQDKMDALDAVRDIAAQAKEMTNKYDRLQAQKEIDKNGIPDEIKNAAKNDYNSLSDEDKAKYQDFADYYNQNNGQYYYAAVDNQVKYNKEQGNNAGGIGSSVNKGIDAATSIISGIISGDITGGLAGASAPYLAEQIKMHTGHYNPEKQDWQNDDEAANLIAHAILGGAVAAVQGNSALAGAGGAAGGELIADAIRNTLYDGRPAKELTEEEKQNISNLAQLAAGLATAAAGGSTSDAATAASASKNSVENNAIGVVVTPAGPVLVPIIIPGVNDANANEQIALALENALKNMGKTIKDILNPDGSIDMNAAEAILSPEQQAQLKAQIIKEREGNQIALGKPLVQDMNEYLTTNENVQFLKERTELVGYDAGGNPVYKATSGAGNFINADDQIKLSGSKDALLVYDKNGICIGALNLDGSRNDTLTAIYKGGNLSTINDKPIPNNTGGNQIPTPLPPLPGLVPPENLAPNNTGHGDGLDNIEIQHDTGGNQIPEAIPALPGYQIPDNDWQNNALTADNRLPIPEKTTASNGLDVESNTKHTPGAPGFRPNAGVEPKNSLDLFEKSVPTGDPKVRLAIDNEGNIHRFSNSSKDGTGSYHWSGSTGDKNSLGHNELRKFNDIIKELRGK